MVVPVSDTKGKNKPWNLLLVPLDCENQWQTVHVKKTSHICYTSKFVALLSVWFGGALSCNFITEYTAPFWATIILDNLLFLTVGLYVIDRENLSAMSINNPIHIKLDWFEQFGIHIYAGSSKRPVHPETVCWVDYGSAASCLSLDMGCPQFSSGSWIFWFHSKHIIHLRKVLEAPHRAGLMTVLQIFTFPPSLQDLVGISRCHMALQEDCWKVAVISLVCTMRTITVIRK